MDTKIQLFIRLLWIPILSAIIFMASGWSVNKFILKPKFAATSTIYIIRPSVDKPVMDYAEWYFQYNFAKDVKDMLKSEFVLDEAISRLEPKYKEMKSLDSGKFADSISVSKGAESRLLEVTFTGNDAEFVISSVNTLIDILKDKIYEIFHTDNIKILKLASQAKIKVLDEKMVLGLSAVAGLAFGLILVYFLILFRVIRKS